MNPGKKTTLTTLIVAMTMPGFSVESHYLDNVPITYPGDFLAPADFYMQVPPPTGTFVSTIPFSQTTLYDLGVLKPQNTNVSSASGSAYSPDLAEENESDNELRVFIKAGLDHATDVPLTVLKENLAEAENMVLVDEGEDYDILVEVETMKLAASGTVFIVINAYKDVNGESLIFHNNFGYLGELKLLSGSLSYATALQDALERELDPEKE